MRSEFNAEDGGYLPNWIQNVSSALAFARESAPERSLVSFLAALSTETLRLAVSDSGEAGEVVVFAAILLHRLFKASRPPMKSSVNGARASTSSLLSNSYDDAATFTSITATARWTRFGPTLA